MSVPQLTEPELLAFIKRVLPSATIGGESIQLPPPKVAYAEMRDFLFPDGDYDPEAWEPEAIVNHAKARLTDAEFHALHWLLLTIESRGRHR